MPPNFLFEPQPRKPQTQTQTQTRSNQAGSFDAPLDPAHLVSVPGYHSQIAFSMRLKMDIRLHFG
ncbi:hypothetical protein PGQ11_015321 [Apiospora arundinis]|uniref:Uncharacterized protein n=1 Tax=Apiospora arundinis TaxID=335852 RepID=A0ABR2HLC8_9PEZI